jgi:hypothetical protein
MLLQSKINIKLYSTFAQWTQLVNIHLLLIIWFEISNPLAVKYRNIQLSIKVISTITAAAD